MEKIRRSTSRTSIQRALRKINYALRVLPNVKEFTVAGSKGKTYYVMRVETAAWECTCPDYRFRRRTCKHIKRINI
jgi:hypothetical protein